MSGLTRKPKVKFTIKDVHMVGEWKRTTKAVGMVGDSDTNGEEGVSILRGAESEVESPTMFHRKPFRPHRDMPANQLLMSIPLDMIPFRLFSRMCWSTTFLDPFLTTRSAVTGLPHKS
jgi:hypothetical protein